MPSEVKKLAGVVGFANLPNQYLRRSTKLGFQLNLLVVGESGIGKSTLINSLFGKKIYPTKEVKPVSSETSTSVIMQTYFQDLEENKVKLGLTVVDAVGFGDSLNNENSWKPIVDYLEDKYDAYLDQERRVNRKKSVDTRIHCCLYFISPTGHCLKPLDIETMKALHERVNIIPIIAKADTLTEEERLAFKKRVLDDIDFHKINIFNLDDDEPDQDFRARIRELQEKTPFAIVASEEEYDLNGQKVRGRKYPWGVIDIENEEHSDFIKLRNLIIRHHMEDLKTKTHEILYEKYRSEKLVKELGVGAKGKKGDPLSMFDEEKKQHEEKMKKMEKEMKQVFSQKVKEKENKLAATEDKLKQEYNETKENLNKEFRELEEKKKTLEETLRAGEKKSKKSALF